MQERLGSSNCTEKKTLFRSCLLLLTVYSVSAWEVGKELNKSPKNSQELRWDLHDKIPSATLQTYNNTQCEVQPKKKKKKQLWSHFLQHSHSQCKQTSKLFHSLPFSHRLSWHHCFEIMPEIKRHTLLCCLPFSHVNNIYLWAINENCNFHYQFFNLSFIHQWYIYCLTKPNMKALFLTLYE